MSQLSSEDHIRLECWKQAVEVEKHFNELHLKLRSFLLTLVVAVVGAAGLAVKEDAFLRIGNQNISLAWVMVAGGLLAILGFYVTDMGYLLLLKGAVGHASAIEKHYEADEDLNPFALSAAISKKSAESVLGISNSDKRLRLLYIVLAFALVSAGVFGQCALNEGHNAANVGGTSHATGEEQTAGSALFGNSAVDVTVLGVGFARVGLSPAAVANTNRDSGGAGATRDQVETGD